MELTVYEVQTIITTKHIFTKGGRTFSFSPTIKGSDLSLVVIVGRSTSPEGPSPWVSPPIIQLTKDGMVATFDTTVNEITVHLPTSKLRYSSYYESIEGKTYLKAHLIVEGEVNLKDCYTTLVVDGVGYFLYLSSIGSDLLIVLDEQEYKPPKEHRAVLDGRVRTIPSSCKCLVCLWNTTSEVPGHSQISLSV